MSAELVITYMATISAVTIVLTQLLKTGVIYPRMTPGPVRDTLIQTITYLLNFILLAVTLATRGEWDWQNLVLYILAALNQSIASSGVYTLVTKSQTRNKIKDATDVIVPPESSP